MNIATILMELRAERDRIDQAISAIEPLHQVGQRAGRRGLPNKTQASPSKRGRRRMSTVARRKLSQLLKQRWAQGKMGPRRKAA